MKTKIIKVTSLSMAFLLGTLSSHVSAQNDTTPDTHVYLIVPQMPTFRENLDNYMSNHLQYPQSAIDRGIQGTVNVTFVINQTGDVTDVSILSGVSPDLDSEAVRIVNNMPVWNPGIKNGKAVKVQYNLPIYFELSSLPGPQQKKAHDNYKPTSQDTTFILRDGLYIDPYIGYGQGGPKSSSSTIIELKNNLKAGVSICYMFPSNFGISIGVQVQQYDFGYSYSALTNSSSYNGTATGYRTSTNDTTVTAGYNETITYSFMYAQVPLLCRYISSQENKLGFYAEAGLVANYLISSQISGTATQTQYQLTQTPDTYWYMYSSTFRNSTTVSLPSGNPAKFTGSAHLAAGLLIPISTKISCILDASSDIGIMNAGDGSKDFISFGTSKLYLYGNGNYGSFTAYLFEVKMLLKMSGASKTILRNY